jgi:hypothetical protein
MKIIEGKALPIKHYSIDKDMVLLLKTKTREVIFVITVIG